MDGIARRVDDVARRVDDVTRLAEAVARWVDDVGRQVVDVARRVDAVARWVNDVARRVDDVAKRVDAVARWVDDVALLADDRQLLISWLSVFHVEPNRLMVNTMTPVCLLIITKRVPYSVQVCIQPMPTVQQVNVVSAIPACPVR